MAAEEGAGAGGTGGMEALEFAPDWVMSCLWTPKGERCQVDIPDTLVMCEGELRWLYTGRNGLVAKKKGAADRDLIERHFMEAALANPQNITKRVATVQHKDGGFRIMNEGAFQGYVKTFPGSDPSLGALQCYVQSSGHAGTIYRSRYVVKNDKGRILVTTHQYTTLSPDAAAEPVVYVNLQGAQRPLVRSVATRIVGALDATTRRVVRHLETTQHVRVLDISLDYAVDDTLKAWLLWGTKASAVRGVCDLREVSSLPLQQTWGRTSWLGPHMGKEGRGSPTRSLSPSRDTEAIAAHRRGSAAMTNRLQQIEYAAGEVEKTSAERVGSPLRLLPGGSGGSSLASGGPVSHELLSKPSMIDGSSESERKEDVVPLGARMSVPLVPRRGHDTAAAQYPAPTKCQGDFCKLVVVDPDPLGGIEPPTGTELDQDFPELTDLARRLLTRKELALLVSSGQFRHILSLLTDGQQQSSALVAHRSILLARQEKRKGTGGKRKRPIRSFAKATESFQSYEQWGVQRGDKEGGLANYYDQVNVCERCWHAYNLLDKTRDVLTVDEKRRAEAAARIESSDLILDPQERAQYAHLLAHKRDDKMTSVGGSDASTRKGRARHKVRKRGLHDMRSGSDGEGDPSWRDRLTQDKDLKHIDKKGLKKSIEGFEGLDDYIRGRSAATTKKAKAAHSALKHSHAVTDAKAQFQHGKDKQPGKGLYCAKVLLGVERGAEWGAQATTALRREQYVVSSEDNRFKVVDQALSGNIDALLLDRDLPEADLFQLVRAIRDGEKLRRHLKKEKKDANPTQEEAPQKMLPIIVVTDKTSPDDLRLYMEGGLDGCVSKPLKDEASLLNTLLLALPKHLSAIEQPMTTVPKFEREKPKVLKTGALGSGEANGSAAMAAATLAISANLTRADGSTSGVVQVDSQTTMPYTVLDYTLATQSMRNEGEKPYFNLVVVNDFFDTHERFKIFFRPMTTKYPGLQVLLWSYPGQAGSEVRSDQCLNNEYLASCLSQLLTHVGPSGTKEFDSSRPFHLLGFGNGACVATYYAAFYRNPSLRSLIPINGFTYIDPNLAGVLHDCLNVFSCSPPSRPDLPVYFWSRFLFSPHYLSRVSTPLALNLYTAVHNPITVQGRLQIINGALSHVDLRPLLKDIHVPIIAVHSTVGALARPSMLEPLKTRRNGEARSIFAALNGEDKVHVVWLRAGHEVFQEAREAVQVLMEQLCTGFHEKHDVAFLPAMAADPDFAPDDAMGDHNLAKEGHKRGKQPGPMNSHFEDKFIDGVLKTMGQGGSSKARPTGAGTLPSSPSSSALVLGSPGKGQGKAGGGEMQRREAMDSWARFSESQHQAGQQGATQDPRAAAAHEHRPGRSSSQSPDRRVILDPEVPGFERQGNAVYAVGQGSLVYPDPVAYPEVREYMRWRLRRNRKRFQRLDAAARSIQGAYRGHLARKVVRNLRLHRAALMIQRVYRGYRGRLRFLERLRRVWAAQLIQRHYRAHSARLLLAELRRRRAAVVQIQRIARGRLSRKYVHKLRRLRHDGALMMQCCWRRYWAKRVAFRKRHERNAAKQVQRVFRGHLGRRRAAVERDKYIFSKSQSQGIEFGRQMLLEHKLHATRLQSEVSMLNHEKLGVEEATEALLEEISEFEEAVNTLEKEMHQLSKIETEALGVLDESTRQELREQKMRLDSEFGEMLGKMADRKERLQLMERKLGELDRQRQAKEDELRTLERKLVVLLEEQQRELEAIRRRQAKKGELLLKTQEAIAAGDLGAVVAGEEGSGGGHVGPSMKEKKQAAQLMQSTETLMKFGFMSMSMTYFSSLNLIRAMRTVAAQDTIMAALSANTAAGMGGASGSAAGGVGGGAGGSSNMAVHEIEDKLGSQAFKPHLKPGQLPGQETLRVAAWSVDDVARWLQTLCLGQYREAFVDAAIDGSFLYDLNEDDLKNSLGVEHRLHRKKVLSAIGKLRLAESEREKAFMLKHLSREQLLNGSGATGSAGLGGFGGMGGMSMGGGGMGASEAAAMGMVPPLAQMGAAAGQGMGQGGVMTAVPTGELSLPGSSGSVKLDMKQLMSWVRHSKNGKLKTALDTLATRKFDPSLINVQYVKDFGTAYVDAYEQEPFNLNKVDDYGNTLLHVASQNGNEKVARLLIAKGANPNHQNKQGNTPGHYAVAYHFYDLATWLFDTEGGAANDTLENRYGLTPYDGLSVDGSDEGAESATSGGGESDEASPRMLEN